jgi:hypothetical protein
LTDRQQQMLLCDAVTEIDYQLSVDLPGAMGWKNVPENMVSSSRGTNQLDESLADF